MLERNEDWLARLKKVECSDATFPSTDPALVFARGKGAYIYDVEGNEYIDLCAGFGVQALGHNPNEISSVYRQRLYDEERNLIPPIVHGMGDVYPSKAKVELIETLIGILPKGLSKVILSLTGGQAVETALKTAMLATQCSGFIAFQGAYHGLDLGVLPLTSRADFREPFLSWQRQGRVVHLPFGASKQLIGEAIIELQRQGAGFAGIVVEPIQGRAGVRCAPEGWLSMLRDLSSTHHGMLIFDEVFTGLGRSGRLSFAEETLCDLLCLGKALGGGFPLSACVGSFAAMEAWPKSSGEALHTGTFFGHPLSCEVAKVTLNAIISQNLPSRAKWLGEQLKNRLETSLGPRAITVRGEGLMTAIEFQQPGAGAKLMNRLRKERVIALASGEQGQCLQITPALNIPEQVLYEAVDRIERTILEV